MRLVSGTPGRDVQRPAVLAVPHSPLQSHLWLLSFIPVGMLLLEAIGELVLLLLQVVEVEVHGAVGRRQSISVALLLLVEVSGGAPDSVHELLRRVVVRLLARERLGGALVS